MPEDEPPINNVINLKHDLMHVLAYKAAHGEGGGDYIYCVDTDQFYFYNVGVWEMIFDTSLLARICRAMPNLNIYSITTRKKLLDNLKLIKEKPLSEFNRQAVLNLSNGTIDPYNPVIQEHTPDTYSTIKMPYVYDTAAECTLWLKTLNEIFEDDQKKINALQEFVGYCLTRDVKMEKGLLLLGASRSGKSTIIHTIEHLIGKNNCAYLALKNLSNPQYTSMLINKLVNIDTDVSKRATDYEDEYKKIATGESINCNGKWEKTISIKPFCKMVLSANEFPRITDHSSAFFNRLILLPCDRVFEEHEQNRNLREELLKELPGVMNWALAGLKRLTERGMFLKEDFMREAVEELRLQNNPAEIFLNDFIVPDITGNYEIVKGELYDKYKVWCKETENWTLSAAKFSSCVFAKYGKYTPKNTNNVVTNKRVWRNLRYIDGHEQQQAVNWTD